MWVAVFGGEDSGCSCCGSTPVYKIVGPFNSENECCGWIMDNSNIAYPFEVDRPEES